jgi:hypothetical protein
MEQVPAGLNVNAAPFNMDGFICAAAGLEHECCLPDFIKKPEAWFKCVEAQLEDAKVAKSKDKYNKVLGNLPVHIIEELAPVTDNSSAIEEPYTELKQHLIADYSCSKWENLDSQLSFPKMGANKRQSVLLAWLNKLKPQSLEELFMAIYLRVLPGGYHEYFLQCHL